MTHVITGEALAVRKEFAKAEHLIERRGWRRQSTLRLGQELSLAVHHLHAKASRIGMAVHEGDTFRESVVLHHRVGVEEQDILARRDADGLVVGAAEAHIFLVGDDLHLGELLGQHLQRSIDGVVVDHKHLALDTLHGAAHRVQALLKEILDVVVDDDDGKFHTLWYYFGEGCESRFTLRGMIFGPFPSGRPSPMFS